MKTLKNYLIPNFDASSSIIISLDDLKNQGGVFPDRFYVVLDETKYNKPQLINMKILLLQDSSEEYILIVEESSLAERWRTHEDMCAYHSDRIKFLDEQKRNIIVTSDDLNDDYTFLQYYIMAGKSDFRHIIKLIHKIEKQIKDYRNNYAEPK